MGRIYEDAYLLPAVISRAQKLLMLPDVLYYYRMRPMSITHTRDGRLNQWLEATSPLVELAKEKYPSIWTSPGGATTSSSCARWTPSSSATVSASTPAGSSSTACCASGWRAALSALPQVRPMRRAYALAALLCPDLVAAYVRRRCRRDRGILTYEH